MKLTRIVTWNFLLLATYLLLPVGSIVPSAQGQSTTTQLKLEGTKWRGAATTFLRMGDIDTRYFDYVFGEKGKVRVQYNREVTGSRSETRWNNSTQSYETTSVNTVISNSLFAEVGTYKQTGNSIHLDFGDHSIDAIVKSASMEGIITLKISGEKAKWGAQKTSNDSQQVNSNIPKQSNVIIPNKSTTLSMEERLPKQLGQFKRGELYVFTYIPETGENPLLEYAYGGHKGEVKGAHASYDRVSIRLTKFKDSAKAIESLQENFNKESAPYIIKKEPVKNRSGQIMGELSVWQHKSDNFSLEVIRFTDGLYLYYIESKVFGEAQKLQKLLPLE